jgi:hypothetical protein
MRHLELQEFHVAEKIQPVLEHLAHSNQPNFRLVAVAGKPENGDRVRQPVDVVIRRDWSPVKRVTVTARRKL